LGSSSFTKCSFGFSYRTLQFVTLWSKDQNILLVFALLPNSSVAALSTTETSCESGVCAYTSNDNDKASPARLIRKVNISPISWSSTSTRTAIAFWLVVRLAHPSEVLRAHGLLGPLDLLVRLDRA